MILLQLKGDKVVGAYLDISPDYKPKNNEVLVEELPHVDLKDNQRAYIYYRNGKIEYEIKEK
jgi:hypothetical protein